MKNAFRAEIDFFRNVRQGWVKECMFSYHMMWLSKVGRCAH